EAELNLDAIKKSNKTHYVEKAAYVVGSAPVTPTATCCGAPGVTQCAANAAAWSGVAAWDELDFEITEAHYFVYSYSGPAGADYTATATGDLDCDTVTVDYVLIGSSSGGSPSSSLSKPARAD